MIIHIHKHLDFKLMPIGLAALLLLLDLLLSITYYK